MGTHGGVFWVFCEVVMGLLWGKTGLSRGNSERVLKVTSRQKLGDKSESIFFLPRSCGESIFAARERFTSIGPLGD